MLKIVGNDIWRGGEKIGWISGNDVWDMSGVKRGYTRDNDIYDMNGHKLGYVEGDYVHTVSGGSFRLEENRARVSGSDASDLMRAAVRLLLGD